jgi:hypothetical protein
MSKLKKLVVTVGVLAVLAVGGAAFAQAQNASIPATAPAHRSVSEQESPGDAEGVQSGSQDQAGETDARDSASEQNDAPDSVSENDSPDGPNESADGPDQESQDD